MSTDFDVVDALAAFAEDLHDEGNFALRLHDAVKKIVEERDSLKADLDVVDSDLQLAVKRLTAEVERLQGAKPELPPRLPYGGELPRYGLRWNGPVEPIAVPMDDGYWTPWHLADAAYRRGAEAMREACALEVRSYSVTVTDPLGRRVELGVDGLGALADAIRALPVPEEKP